MVPTRLLSTCIEVTEAGLSGSASGLDLALNMGMKFLKGRSISCHSPFCVSKLLQKKLFLQVVLQSKRRKEQNTASSLK